MTWRYYTWLSGPGGRTIDAILRQSTTNVSQRWDGSAWIDVSHIWLLEAIEEGNPMLDEISAARASELTGTTL